MRCFYSQSLELELPSGHPFPMEKFRVSKEMLLQENILRADEITEVKEVDFHHILRVHDRSYIERVQSNLLGRKEQILLAIDKAMRWREMVRQNKALKQRLDGN